MLELYRILNSSFGDNTPVTYEGKLRGYIILSFFHSTNRKKLISFGGVNIFPPKGFLFSQSSSL